MKILAIHEGVVGLQGTFQALEFGAQGLTRVYSQKYFSNIQQGKRAR